MCPYVTLTLDQELLFHMEMREQTGIGPMERDEGEEADLVSDNEL